MDNQFDEIPSAFHSFDENDLFKHCIECDKYLLDEECDYMIEKAVRNYPGYTAHDVIFDFAICMDCALAFQQKMSKSSRAAIEKYMIEHVDFHKRSHELMKGNKVIEDCLDKCMISKERRENCEEYQMVAFCRGAKIHRSIPPYLISHHVLNELSVLISDETQDDMDGFYKKHFSPSPGLFEPDPKLILI